MSSSAKENLIIHLEELCAYLGLILHNSIETIQRIQNNIMIIRNYVMKSGLDHDFLTEIEYLQLDIMLMTDQMPKCTSVMLGTCQEDSIIFLVRSSCRRLWLLYGEVFPEDNKKIIDYLMKVSEYLYYLALSVLHQNGIKPRKFTIS